MATRTRRSTWRRPVRRSVAVAMLLAKTNRCAGATANIRRAVASTGARRTVDRATKIRRLGAMRVVYLSRSAATSASTAAGTNAVRDYPRAPAGEARMLWPALGSPPGGCTAIGATFSAQQAPLGSTPTLQVTVEARRPSSRLPYSDARVPMRSFHGVAMAP